MRADLPLWFPIGGGGNSQSKVKRVFYRAEIYQVPRGPARILKNRRRQIVFMFASEYEPPAIWKLKGPNPRTSSRFQVFTEFRSSRGRGLPGLFFLNFDKFHEIPPPSAEGVSQFFSSSPWRDPVLFENLVSTSCAVQDSAGGHAFGRPVLPGN